MKRILGLAMLCLLVMVSKVSAQETASSDTLQGYQFYKSGDYPNAEKSLQAALKLDPSSATAHQLLGSVYLGENRRAEALAEYQTSLNLMPNNPALVSYVQTLQGQTPTVPVAAATAAPTSLPALPTALAATNELDKAHFVIGAFGGIALPGTGFSSYEGLLTYGLGYGGGTYFGVAFDRHFSVALKFSDDVLPETESGYDYGFFTTPSITYYLSQILIMNSCKYIIGDKGVRPYVTAGLGMDIGINSVDNLGTTVPVIEGGLGVNIPFDERWSFFAEADWDIAIAIEEGEDETVSYFPFNVGFQFDAR